MPENAASTVLVIGEALMDITEGPSGVVETPGGGPANIALGLGRRGIPVALLTSLGHDERGDIIAAHLAGSGVRVLPASFRPGATSTARATLDETGAATYAFDIDWALLDDALDEHPAVVHTGSLAAFLAPGADSVQTILRAHPDAVVTFDPNIRPDLVGPADDARATFEAIARRAWVVKLSDEDAAYLYPGLSVAEVTDEILALGPELVAVTLGGEGAVLATARDRATVPAPRVDVVDTIGAGDTFMASLLAEPVIRARVPLTRQDLAAIGARAVAAAAITVSRAGADLPWSHELDA